MAVRMIYRVKNNTCVHLEFTLHKLSHLLLASSLLESYLFVIILISGAVICVCVFSLYYAAESSSWRSCINFNFIYLIIPN